ncbi:MAG: alanine racemase C-terminal domain-containing protein, partial [Phycisphaeraceae bacterium]|nr:alanine racemase C-terminal domain-containing protein [Phycisphaeraceae bacterium]
MTHMATADTDPANLDEQRSRFETLRAKITAATDRPLNIHTDNTHAGLRTDRPDHTMVRVGLGLLGYGCETVVGELADFAAQLQPVVTWRGKVVHVADRPAGAHVGYGATWRLKQPARLAVVPVGYSDGYPLALSNAGVLTSVNGEATTALPVRGRVNMDQIVIDVTDAPDVGLGSTVEIYSGDPASPAALPNLAETAGSHVYELLCRLSPRLTRRWIND